MDDKSIAKKIETYARENIPEGNKDFGEFMYHAELIRRGHWNIHYEDLEDMSEQYRVIIEELCTDGEDSIFKKLDKDLARYL
jgi:hypothetical protein